MAGGDLSPRPPIYNTVGDNRRLTLSLYNFGARDTVCPYPDNYIYGWPPLREVGGIVTISPPVGRHWAGAQYPLGFFEEFQEAGVLIPSTGEMIK